MKTNLKLKATKKEAKLEAAAAAELDKAVEAFRVLRTRIAILEAELKIPREIMQKAAEKSLNGIVTGTGYKISLIDCEREVFDLKAARVVLGKRLGPFLSVSSYKQMRVI